MKEVIECARELGIPGEAITDDILEGVVQGMKLDGRWWRDVVKDAINYALKS
jgi:hypothetical protein